MVTTRALFVSGLCLLGTACATGPQARPSGSHPDQFSLHGDQAAFTARAVGTPAQGNLFGPNVRVEWNEQRVQGQAFGRAVSLTTRGDTVKGLYGTSPVQLRIEEEKDGSLTARGLFGGRLSNLRLGGNELDGTIGRCSYDLERSGGIYLGWRQCRGLPERVRVEIPQTLTALPRPQMMASLGLLLGTG